MSHAAIVKFVRYLGEVEFVVKDQLFHTLDFIDYDIVLNSNALYFRKSIGKIGVIVTKFFTKEFGEIYLRDVIRIVYQLRNYVSYFFY